MSLRIIPLNSSLSYMRTHEINAHEPLGIILLETAKQIFRECGAEHDFAYSTSQTIIKLSNKLASPGAIIPYRYLVAVIVCCGIQYRVGTSARNTVELIL